jgi:hypothetical protein
MRRKRRTRLCPYHPGCPSHPDQGLFAWATAIEMISRDPWWRLSIPCPTGNRNTLITSSGPGTTSLVQTNKWVRKVKRPNKYLSLVNYKGEPMAFRSHMLRDTLAVEMLLKLAEVLAGEGQ